MGKTKKLQVFLKPLPYKKMNVDVINKQTSLNISTENVQLIVKEVLYLENKTCDEIAVYFVDTAEISALHEKFFDDPSPTDCISFPIDSQEKTDYCILGDVFVCPQTAIEYASQHNTDSHSETTLYIVHGILHLLGYDDITEKDYVIMKKKESKHMDNLKQKGVVLNK